MNLAEIRALLIPILEREPKALDVPSSADWSRMEDRFNTHFPPEFKAFIELMSEFEFPGEIFNVVETGLTNGNDGIDTVYESECTTADWPPHLIPFYGIGNGDYFALDARQRENSAVYYRYHESGRVEQYSDSFGDWLRQLPAFLRCA